MLLIVFSMFVFCMQCAYMKYTGWEFDFHAKDLFRPFGAPSPGMPPASRTSRPCAEKATSSVSFADTLPRGEGCMLCNVCMFCRRAQAKSLPHWGRGTAIAVDEVLGLNNVCV